MDTGDGAAAFDLLADETRVAILRALTEAWAEAGSDGEYALSFSALRRATGVESSSRFNYHLGRLRGRLVRRTDAGYVFTYAGWRVARAVRESTFETTPDPDRAPVDGRCPDCGARSLATRYVNEWLRVDCRDCGTTATDAPAPPAVAGRNADARRRAVDERGRRRVALAGRRTCPRCLGTTDRAVGTVTWGPDEWTRLRHDCPDCGHSTHPPLGGYVLESAQVAAFYRARGVDVAEAPRWSFGPAVRDRYVERGDQWVVSFPAPDATLAVTVTVPETDPPSVAAATERPTGAERGHPIDGSG